MMKAAYRKIISDILNKPHVPRKVKALHGDIEDAVEAAGGKRGGLRG